MFFRSLCIVALLILIQACNTGHENNKHLRLSDPQASSMATALFENLQKITDNHVLLGHTGDTNNIDDVPFKDMMLSLSELPDLYHKH